MRTLYAKCFLLSMALNLSCNSGDEVSTASGFSQQTKSLGNIYKSIEDSYLDANCVKGEEFISSENTPKKISYQKNSTFEDLKKQLSVSSKLSGNYMTVKGDTSLNWAVDQQVTTTDETHSFIWQAVKGRRKFVTNSVGLDNSILTPGRKKQLQNDPRAIYEFCGDGFISEVEYGASLLVSLRFQFLTETDKNEFNQKVNIDYDGGVLKLKSENEYKNLSNRIKETGQVILEAQQIGGNDSGLLDIISEQMPSCSMKNLEQCMQVMNGVLQYAGRLKTNFDSAPATEDIAKKWDVIDYTMTDYQDLRKSDAYNFFNVELPEISKDFMDLRNLLIKEWIANRTVLAEAQRYKFATGISSDRSVLIEYVIEKLESNENILDSVQNLCYESSYEECSAEWNRRSSEIEDVAIEFKLFKRVMDKDSENADLCEAASNRIASKRGNDKKLLDSALFGPKRNRVKVAGHHWNIPKMKSYSITGRTISVKGQLIRSIQGLSDDKFDYSCTWGTGGKISMSKKIDYNNSNRGWTNAAVKVSEMICQHAFDKFVMEDRVCN